MSNVRRQLSTTKTVLGKQEAVRASKWQEYRRLKGLKPLSRCQSQAWETSELWLMKKKLGSISEVIRRLSRELNPRDVTAVRCLGSFFERLPVGFYFVLILTVWI
jgi:hypothetical protein